MTSKTGSGSRGLPLVARVALTLFALPFIVGGAYFVAYSVQAWSEALDSEGWPTARATVVKTDLHRARRSHGHYTPTVTYHYRFGALDFTGERLRIVGESMPEAEARQTLVQFAPGREVDVRVNPDAPDASVLIPGTGWGVYAGLTISLSVTVVGALTLYFAWFGTLSGVDASREGRTGPGDGKRVAELRSLGPRDLETLRARFRPLADEYRRRTRRFWLLLPVYAVCGVVVIFFDGPPGILLLCAAGASAALVAMFRFLPRLPPCPACAGELDSHLGRFCPGCGSRFQAAAGWRGSRRCGACGKEMAWTYRGLRLYRIHACTHCGVMLDAAGL